MGMRGKETDVIDPRTAAFLVALDAADDDPEGTSPLTF